MQSNNINKTKPTGSFPPIIPKVSNIKLNELNQPTKKSEQHGISIVELLNENNNSKNNPFNF